MYMYMYMHDTMYFNVGKERGIVCNKHLHVCDMSTFGTTPYLLLLTLIAITHSVFLFSLPPSLPPSHPLPGGHGGKSEVGDGANEGAGEENDNEEGEDERGGGGDKSPKKNKNGKIGKTQLYRYVW